MSLRDLWKALTHGERAEAIRAALEVDGADARAWAVSIVARQRKFRRKSVAAWDDDRLVTTAARLAPRPSVLSKLLEAFHLGRESELPERYLDHLGIPHEDGALEALERDPTAEEAEAAARTLLSAFAPRAVFIYLLTLRLHAPALVPEAERWLPVLYESGEVADGRPDEEATEEEVATEATSPDETDEFTTLDRQLVRAIVDSAQGVHGSLDADEILDLVEELIELNSTRERSFFHLGFADVVLGRGPRPELPAQDATRLAWYWSGYLNGLDRDGRLEEIARRFDESDVIQGLGRSAQGASSSAAGPVFEALCAAGRHGEAADFLSVEALTESPRLARLVHDRATSLLWNDRAPEARAMMDLLGAWIEHLEHEGYDTSGRFSLEIRRRRAHCFRHLGEMENARSILERLLEIERDEEIRSMVHTDLGLIAGDFRSLSAIRLPDEDDRVGEIREALERGEESFVRGAAVESRYGGHGHYCLGVLAMTRRKWHDARRHLELAASVFEAEPARYRAGGLIERARSYQGLALALELDQVRVSRAADLIVAAVGAGARVPRYLVSKSIDCLHLGSPERAQAVAETLVQSEPATLDLLIESEVMRVSAGLQAMLVSRSRDPSRRLELRAQDGRTVLPHLLARGAVDDAAEVLDSLEELALGGTGADELVTLLESAESFDPAWEPRDALWARIRLLCMGRRFDEAARLLTEAFYRELHRGGYGARGAAEDVLDALTELGRPEGELEPLRRALEATSVENGTPDVRESALRARVLFVGGDERQRLSTRQVKRELAESHPEIHVRFIRTGWSGHWGPTLDQVREALPSYDALVIMRFVRTQFGRRLRAETHIPWTACTGAGKETIRRSILRAAEWASNAGGVDDEPG